MPHFCCPIFRDKLQGINLKTMQTRISNKSFFGAAIGTMIEYYDYVLFSIFLPIFSPLFFPAASTYESLVKGYFILLITLFARPLGGIFFGYLGDFLGRRKALLTSMYGIALGTFLIGIIPSYATIGIWATSLIIFGKAIQIFCFGGEYNGAGIYVVEHAQNKREALYGSLLTAMTSVGSLIASLTGVILTLPFMPEWSWRIAFMLGGLIGVFGIIYRKNLLESPHFVKADVQAHSINNMVKRFPRELLAGVFIGGFATVPFVTVLTFINPVLMTKGYFTSHQLMLMQTLFSFVALLSLIFVGAIADKKTPKKVMLLSCVCLAIFSYPLLLLVDSGKLFLLIPSLAMIIVINEFLLGPSNAFLKNLFPMQYRYRGASLSFCLGMSLFGGITPIIENCLYKMTGQFSVCSLWLIFIGVGTYLSIQWATTWQSKTKIEDCLIQPETHTSRA